MTRIIKRWTKRAMFGVTVLLLVTLTLQAVFSATSSLTIPSSGTVSYAPKRALIQLAIEPVDLYYT